MDEENDEKILLILDLSKVLLLNQLFSIIHHHKQHDEIIYKHYEKQKDIEREFYLFIYFLIN